MNKVLIGLLLCLPSCVHAGETSEYLESLAAPTASVTPSTPQPVSVTAYRRALSPEDIDSYLTGIAMLSSDTSCKERVDSLILAGSETDKIRFLAENSEGKTILLIRRSITPDKGVCTWVTTTVCTLACYGTGVERECMENCRDILVKSCD